MKQTGIIRKIGRILLINTLNATPNLMDNISSQIDRQEDSFNTVFSSLTDNQLYSRLFSDINFSKLSEQDKIKFLLLKPEMANSVDKQNLYANEMQQFVQEAHNRTCDALGVQPTNVIVCDFGENVVMDPWGFSMYDNTNGNIYLNSKIDYSSLRPTFLLECINARTYQHSIYQNMATLLTNQEWLSDADYYMSISSAIRDYVNYENANNENIEMSSFDDEGYSPSSIYAQIYAFEKSRQDLQNAGLYGAEAREGLREAEIEFHNDLQKFIGNESLLSTEDIFAYFKDSELNRCSNGFLGSILDNIDRSLTSACYNGMGASMESGITVREHLDSLERDMFSSYGLTPPSDEELEELIEMEQAEREMLEEQEKFGLAQYDEDEKDEYEIDGPSQGRDEDKENISYRPFESVIKQEGVIDKINELPFHRFDFQQDDIMGAEQ